MDQTILFKRLHPDSRLPVRASPHAAGFDLVSVDTTCDADRIIVRTGLATAFDESHVLLIYGRSGYAFKHGIRLLNGVGVIDADYRGEILLAFDKGYTSVHRAMELLGPGNRVAQAILTPIPRTIWQEASELPETVRGSGGFGSTGLSG